MTGAHLPETETEAEAVHCCKRAPGPLESIERRRWADCIDSVQDTAVGCVGMLRIPLFHRRLLRWPEEDQVSGRITRV